MEERDARIIFGKAGGNASRNAYTCKASLPKRWVDSMGINPDKRDITLSFDGDTIRINRRTGSPIKTVPIAENKKIKRFAMIWAQLYRNHKNVPFDLFENIEFLGEGLADLGFIMDCGDSFKKKFPDLNSFQNITEFQNSLDRIDLVTLGNTIFSQWRYWNHWANSPMIEEDYDWFVIAFSRLAELAA